MRDPRYSEPFRRLTNDLTNMYASERRALAVSADYVAIMEALLRHDDELAVALSLQFRDEKGDAWRERAAECGLISTAEFVNAGSSS